MGIIQFKANHSAKEAQPLVTWLLAFFPVTLTHSRHIIRSNIYRIIRHFSYFVDGWFLGKGPCLLTLTWHFHDSWHWSLTHSLPASVLCLSHKSGSMSCLRRKTFIISSVMIAFHISSTKESCRRRPSLNSAIQRGSNAACYRLWALMAESTQCPLAQKA